MMAVAAHVLGNLAPRFGREALRHVAQGAMEIFIHLLRRVLHGLAPSLHRKQFEV